MQIADIAGPFLGKDERKKTLSRTEGSNTGLTQGNDFVLETNQELAYNGEFSLIYINHSFILNKLKVFAMLCIFTIIWYPSRCTQWGTYPKLDCTIGCKVKMKSERFLVFDSSCRRKLKYNVIRCATRWARSFYNWMTRCRCRWRLSWFNSVVSNMATTW